MILGSNPYAQYASHREAIDAAIARILTSGRYVLAQEVPAFENEFAAFCGSGFGVGVNSGTDALILTLRALGLRSDDEVITVSHTAVATVSAIVAAGARPVLVDIDPETYTIDPAAIERAIGPNSRVIIAVHLYGLPAEMDAIMAIAARNGLTVVEDCAQATGARYRGQRVGSIGHAGCFSFYPTKNLGAIGDGGMVVTSDRDLADRIRSLRQYGWDEDRNSSLDGVNSRLDELQAAILRAKLPTLDTDNELRRDIAKLYSRVLADTGLVLPCARDGREHVYHLYVVRSDNRARTMDALKRSNIAAGIHYPLPVHLQRAYKGRGFDPLPLKHTELAANEVLSLPIYPERAHGDVKTVADAILSSSPVAKAAARR